MLRLPAALIALLLACVLIGCGRASGEARQTSSGHRSRTGGGSNPDMRTKKYRGTGGLKTVTVQSGGHQRSYLLYVPRGDSKAHPLPLVLVYHGADDTAAHTASETNLLGIAERDHNMIVVFPQGYQDTWNEGTGHTPAAQAGINDVAFTATILHRVESNHVVDSRRVVAAGFSNGALLTEYLGCTLARQLTLIVPVEGQLPDSISAGCQPAVPISVYEIHGTADTEIPYGGGGFSGVGGGTAVLSAPASAGRWAALDGCAPQPLSATAGAVALSIYSGCQDRMTVTLASVQGGGHQWAQNFGQTVLGAMSSLSGVRRAIR